MTPRKVRRHTEALERRLDYLIWALNKGDVDAGPAGHMGAEVSALEFALKAIRYTYGAGALRCRCFSARGQDPGAARRLRDTEKPEARQESR